MNPQFAFEIDFPFFSSFFSSESDKKKKKKEDNFINKKIQNSIPLNKQNIFNKELYKSSKSTSKEKENEDIKKKETQLKNKYNELIININEDSDEENILNINKKEKEIKKIQKKIIKEINIKNKKTKEELLLFLVYYIKNVFTFRKKVKLLIQKHKEYFPIIFSENKNYLSMNIQINNKKKTNLKFTYEPILNENIFYISRKFYRDINLVKFTFINKNNESIIDPKFNYVYHKGEFYNVINLKKIRKKEKKNTKKFLFFLETYYRIKHISNEENAEYEEKNKISCGKVILNKIHYYSILKKRPMKRIISDKKITFSEKNEIRPYKKD